MTPDDMNALAERVENLAALPFGTGLSSLRDQAATRLAHSASIPSARNCDCRTLCVYCPRLPMCDDWYPMRPGLTLAKWKNGRKGKKS